MGVNVGVVLAEHANLLNLWSLLLLCLGTASLSHFLQVCFESGMIFRRYYLLLTLIWMRNWRKKDRWKRVLCKPMGTCIYCNGTWLFIGLFLLPSLFSLANYRENTTILPIAIGLFLGMGLNYIWIKILEKVI